MKRVFLIIYFALFSLSWTGCATAGDPAPYFSWPKERESTPEEILKHRAEREKYIEDHPELDQRKKNLISVGMTDEGFTKEEVEIAIKGVYPNPDKIEIGRFENGADEMWFYRSVNWNDYYYFKNGILIAQEKFRVKKISE